MDFGAAKRVPVQQCLVNEDSKRMKIRFYAWLLLSCYDLRRNVARRAHHRRRGKTWHHERIAINDARVPVFRVDENIVVRKV